MVQLNQPISMVGQNETTIENHIKSLGNLNQFATKCSPVSRLEDLLPEHSSSHWLHIVAECPISESA